MNIDSNLSHMLLAEQENNYSSSIASPSQVLITPPPSEEEPQPVEKVQRVTPQDVVEFNGIEIDLDNIDPSDVDDDPLDIRSTTPREMVDISMVLYVEGELSFEEYSMLAFQPELHPDFEDTVGSLTGERSSPDRPRDFINEWEDRYNFERRYPSDNPKTLPQIERILSVLHSLEATVDFVA